MKNFSEMADSVLARRDKYMAERRRQRKRIASICSCLGLASLLGLGVWRAETLSKGGVSDMDSYAKEEGLDRIPHVQREVSDWKGEKPIQPGNMIPPNTDSGAEDQPVQENQISTGSLSPYEAVWGGSYTDDAGHTVILLTEDTADNRALVLQNNPDLREDQVVFKPAIYSLAYLTELQSKISQAMVDRELPSVAISALMESENNISVTFTSYNEAELSKLLSFDRLGGAIKIQYSSRSVATQDMLLSK